MSGLARLWAGLTGRAAPLAASAEAAEPTPAGLPHHAEGTRVLREGARGTDVLTAQRGVSAPAADGIFGPRTRAAVVAFQASRGLLADGVVGPRTWVALGFPLASAPLVFAAPPVEGESGRRVLARLRAMRARDPDGWAAVLAPRMAAASVEGAAREAAFLATCSVETGGFRLLEEVLFYTSPDRVAEVWPRRFHNAAAALPFVRQPVRLAERVYGGRMGNRPEGAGDGWRNRGRGLIMTTGAHNWGRLAQHTERPDDDALREWATARDGAAISALAFWSGNGLNAIADRGDLAALRRAVQGGELHLAELVVAHRLALRG